MLVNSQERNLLNMNVKVDADDLGRGVILSKGWMCCNGIPAWEYRCRHGSSLDVYGVLVTSSPTCIKSDPNPPSPSGAMDLVVFLDILLLQNHASFL